MNVDRMMDLETLMRLTKDIVPKEKQTDLKWIKANLPDETPHYQQIIDLIDSLLKYN